MGTALIVEDHIDQAEMVARLLRFHDYVPIIAETGESGLEMARRLAPDVILLDLMLPDINGFDVCRRLRSDRATMLTPVVMLTALGDSENRLRGFRVGANAYVTKPYGMQELFEAISAARAWRADIELGNMQGEIHVELNSEVTLLQDLNDFLMGLCKSTPLDHDQIMQLRQAVDHHNLLVEKARLVEQLQEKNRQLVEANRLKAAFIEVASHELNTPVAVVLGMTELWKMSQDKNATAAERGWIDRIQGASRRLAGTVERMLKLIRSGEFGHTLSLQPTELAPSIRAVVAELGPYLEARRQTVALELAPDLGSAEVDASKFADILTNLLINAIKFTPDGGTLRIGAAPIGPDQVRFEVVDPGVGIEAADRLHLFDLFFTSFDTMHHSSGDYQFCKRGMGLGLCLVKAFVELHGGTIEVASAPGAGSTFAFVLPRQAQAPAPLVVAPS